MDSPGRRAVNSSPKLKTPISARSDQIRREIAQKSPVRSPLREVLKSRCAERMRNSRTEVLNSLRGIEKAEKVRHLVQSEADRLRRGSRRILSFGLSATEVDEALADLEEIELELMNAEGFWEAEELAVLCPLCLRYSLKEISQEWDDQQLVVCQGNCGANLLIHGGVGSAALLLDQIVDEHSGQCCGLLAWGQAENALVALCEMCDYCAAVGGR